MEQIKKIQRSEVWEQIYNVVSKIPRKEVDGDAADAPSVATELEELFLKLLPIHDVMRSAFDAGRERIDHPDWDFVYDDFDDYISQKHFA